MHDMAEVEQRYTGDYVLDTHFADSPTRLSPSLRILRAALWSRPRVNPQCGHWWVRSWSCLATFWPQAEHICVVPRGFTPTDHLPASSALYVICQVSSLHAASRIDLARRVRASPRMFSF